MTTGDLFMSTISQSNVKAKILIVDDKKSNNLLLESMLEQAGYENLWTTADPLSVLSLHRKWSFDLILLDFRMPGLNGIEVMKQLRAEQAHDVLPILMLTAQTDKEIRLQALETGATDFLTKPFDRLEVLHRIHNMLEVRALYTKCRSQADILEDRVRDRTRELRNAQLEVIRRLGRAGEYRDNETGFHVLRVGKTCQLLAQEMALDGEFCANILEASPLHDVGKIGIPDGILLKNGRLDDEERRIMEQHVQIGAEILAGDKSQIMQMAHSIALTHHEKWDGSGYPRRLNGNDIPIEGRITAICDVFDALTSKRPYKEPWETNKAVALLEAQAGRHFDPDLVDVFLRVLPQIVSIKETYADTDETILSTPMIRFHAEKSNDGRETGRSGYAAA